MQRGERGRLFDISGVCDFSWCFQHALEHCKMINWYSHMIASRSFSIQCLVLLTLTKTEDKDKRNFILSARHKQRGAKKTHKNRTLQLQLLAELFDVIDHKVHIALGGVRVARDHAKEVTVHTGQIRVINEALSGHLQAATNLKGRLIEQLIAFFAVRQRAGFLRDVPEADVERFGLDQQAPLKKESID